METTVHPEYCDTEFADGCLTFLCWMGGVPLFFAIWINKGFIIAVFAITFALCFLLLIEIAMLATCQYFKNMRYQRKQAKAMEKRAEMLKECCSKFDSENAVIEKEKAQALADFEQNIQTPRKNLARYKQWRDEFQRVVERAELAG